MSKEVVLLDDDDSDEDVQEIVPSTSNNIVDLTSGGGGAVSSSSRKKSKAEKKKKRRKSAPSKLSEVQFVGVAAGQSSITTNSNASFRNNSNDDIVEFAGVKRPRHSATSQNNQFSNAPTQHQPHAFTNNHFASANGTNNNNTNTFGGRGGHNHGGAAASSRHSFPNSQFGRGYPNDMLDETIGNSLARFGRGAASNIANVGSSVFNAGLNMLEDVTLPDNLGRNRTNQQQFGRGRGNNGRGSGNSYIDQLLGANGLTNDGHTSTIWEREYEQQRRASSGGMKKRKAPPTSKSKGKTEEKPTAMEKGKGLQKPQGFDALDMYYPRLKANERTLILHNMILSVSSSANNSSASTTIQSKYSTKKFVHEWRVKFEKNNSKPTLWSLAKGIADEITRLQQDTGDDDNQKMPAKKKKNGKENKSNMKQDNDNTDDILVVDSEGKEKKVTLQIGPVSGDVLDSLSKYFIAYLNKSKHKTMLDAIEPCQSQGNGLTCSICADDFNLEDTVPCGGLDDIHFYCKGCLSSYCTVTVQSGPIQTMSCPLPSCKALFATADIKSTLSGKQK